MKQRDLIIIFLIWLSFPLTGISQNTSTAMEDVKIEVKQIQDKTSIEIFSYMESKFGLHFSYQSNDQAFHEAIHFPSKKYISFTEFIEVMESNLPYNIVRKDEYIILQKKKLKKKYLIEGRVEDAGTSDPLVAATVYIEAINKGVLTDNNGYFSLLLDPGTYDLGIKYMGYTTEMRHVNLYDDKSLNLEMKEDYQYIGEVKIEAKRKFLGDFERGRTIETIDSKAFSSLSLNNPADVLQARIPGVWAAKTSGAPGDHIRVRIRGISSLYASVDPLYVIDGVPVPKVNLNSLGISDLNVNDIESITVLKDASSNAIYGLQGGNGVILVETKSGGGEPEFNIQYKTGVQSFNKFYDLSNAHDFLQTYTYSDAYHGTSFLTGVVMNNDLVIPPYYPEYFIGMKTDNWQKEMFTRGLLNEYQVNGRGNYKGLNYYVSGNIFDQSGVVERSNFNKKSVLANAGYKFFNRLDVRLNYKGSLIENKNNLDAYLGNPVIFQGLNTSPVYSSTPDSVKNIGPGRLLKPNTSIIHPKEAPYLIDNMERRQEIRSNSMHLYSGIQLTKKLVFEFSAALNLKNYQYSFGNLYYDNPEVRLETNERIAVINREYKLKYEISGNLHQVKINTGFRNYSDNIHWTTPENVDPYIAETHPEIYQRGSMAVFGDKGSTTRKIRSLYTHVNYNYDNRYVFSLAGNYGVLDENGNAFNRDFFPSVAVSWDISKEKILERFEFLNTMELYANWGKAGNYPLNGISKDIYAEAYNYYSQTGSENTTESLPPAQYLQNLANHNIKPEEAIEYNLGARLSLFDQRVIFNFNYYEKKNDNLLLFRDIPLYYAGGVFMMNIGELKSWGREFVFETIPIQSNSFTWYNRFNFSMNRQYISRLDSADIIIPGADLLMPEFKISVNQGLGDVLGYKVLSMYDEDNEIQQDLISRRLAVDYYGIVFAKRDSTVRKLTEDDKTTIGNSIPDFMFSFHNAFRYKNFQLDIILYGVLGVEKFNATRAATYMSGVNSDVNKIMLDDDKYYVSDFIYQSSYFIEDASFIRLKQIGLSYFPDKKWFGCCKPKISVTGENLLTLTHYKGYDPEATIYTNNNFSDNAVDRGAYPNPAGFFLSVNLSF